MENWIPVIIQLASGAVGGNVAGYFLKNQSLGTLGNSIAGILGGGIGGQLLAMIGAGVASGGTDISGIVGSIAGGGVGGAVLLVIVAVVKKLLGK